MVIKLLLPIEKSTTRLFKTAPDLVDLEQLLIDDNNEWTTPSRPTETVQDDNTRPVYIVFDLETTGFSMERHHILEIACELRDSEGNPLIEGQFFSLVKPPTTIPSFITELTGITNDMVEDAHPFQDLEEETNVCQFVT